MKSLVVIVIPLALCWWVTDVRSDSAWLNVWAPLGVVLFTVALLFWGVFALAARRTSKSPDIPASLRRHIPTNLDAGDGE
jgi:hypothetical protein